MKKLKINKIKISPNFINSNLSRSLLVVVIATFVSIGTYTTAPSKAAVSPPPNLYSNIGYSTLHNPDGSLKTKGIILVVHGGGWLGVGKAYADTLQPWANHYNTLGWSTVNVDYRPGPFGFNDVVQWYDWLNSNLGAYYPICVMGNSAGAHYALLLSVVRPDLDCVIAQAAPTDLPNNNIPDTDLHRQFEVNTAAVFGGTNLTAWSPITYARAPYFLPKTPLLLANTVGDPIVDISQQRIYAAAVPGSIALELPDSAVATDPLFGHSHTTIPALFDYGQKEAAFLDSIQRR